MCDDDEKDIKNVSWHCYEKEKKIMIFPTCLKLGVGSGS
jgi:hypothetical protein